MSSIVLCELTGNAPNDRLWICECHTCQEWRSQQPVAGAGAVIHDRSSTELTGRVAASRLNLIQAARAHVAAYGSMIGKNICLDEDKVAEIVLPTSTGPTDHVGMLVIHPGKYK